jgi:selenocysteine lyase/cysteine desulfurase
LSCRPGWDCEALAKQLSGMGIAFRAGLHCAPLAHESAGTLATGTVRVSFGHASHHRDLTGFLMAMEQILGQKGVRS